MFGKFGARLALAYQALTTPLEGDFHIAPMGMAPADTNPSEELQDIETELAATKQALEDESNAADEYARRAVAAEQIVAWFEEHNSDLLNEAKRALEAVVIGGANPRA